VVEMFRSEEDLLVQMRTGGGKSLLVELSAWRDWGKSKVVMVPYCNFHYQPYYDHVEIPSCLWDTESPHLRDYHKSTASRNDAAFTPKRSIEMMLIRPWQ
jgi:hypothetical protein